MEEEIIIKTADYVKEKLTGESSGHDWWHTYRVLDMALKIGKKEKADLFIIQLASLLHDIADWKLYNGNEEVGPKTAREWLEKLQVDEKIISHVCEIIRNISFKGANIKFKMETKEEEVVQDADRLDAMGAMGIARTFAFGGKKGNIIHDPSVPANIKMSEEEYKKSNHTQINHFYEKLLLLKDLMNTKTARQIAESRHKFMESFLEEFFKEWKGEK